ncbi:MAG: SDR family oxidoreductase [Xenococcaceae cyanobacterium]
MKKLLITGASGFLGWNLSQQAQAQWQVFGTYYSGAIVIPNTTIIKIDLRDFSAVKELFAQIQPDAIIHTAAASKPNFCQTNPEESYRINVDASLNLAGLCAEHRIPCVFTSTDLVFDGTKSFYTETDPVSPISHYGEQKVLAERGMLEIYPKTAVCRMPLMFGNVPPTAISFIQPFIDRLKKGEDLFLFSDEFRTPVSGMTAAKGLLLALEKQVSGILHLGGKERISRYQFGELLAEIMQVSPQNIKPCLQKDVPMAAPRSPDTSLDSSKAFALGYQPLSLKEELTALLSSD